MSAAEFEFDYERVKRSFIAETFGGEEDVAVLGMPVIMDRALPFEPEPETASDARAAKLSIEALQAPPQVAEAGAPAPELEELIRNAKRSASLGAYIRAKALRIDRLRYRPALFEQGQISRDYWSRLLNDEVRASKEKLLRVAILLELSLEEAEEMLEKAGYALSPSVLRDVVVSYCLRNEHYNFVLIERMLEDYEIQSLFNDRRGA